MKGQKGTFTDSARRGASEFYKRTPLGGNFAFVYHVHPFSTDGPSIPVQYDPALTTHPSSEPTYTFDALKEYITQGVPVVLFFMDMAVKYDNLDIPVVGESIRTYTLVDARIPENPVDGAEYTYSEGEPESSIGHTTLAVGVYQTEECKYVIVQDNVPSSPPYMMLPFHVCSRFPYENTTVWSKLLATWYVRV